MSHISVSWTPFFPCLLTIFGIMQKENPWTDFVFPCKGGCVDTATHLLVNLPKKKNIFGMNWHFQAKCAKYLNFHVIRTTAVTPTKFCTGTYTPCGSSQNVPHKSKMAYSFNLEKNEKPLSQPPLINCHELYVI